MYSEALAIMDRNIIQFTLEAELSDAKEQIAEKDKLLADKDNIIADKDSIIAKQLADK